MSNDVPDAAASTHKLVPTLRVGTQTPPLRDESSRSDSGRTQSVQSSAPTQSIGTRAAHELVPAMLTRRQATLTLLTLLGSTQLGRADDSNSSETSDAGPLHQVSLRDTEGNERRVNGRLLVKAVDGGLLLEDRAGRLWPATREQLVNDETLDETFSPLTPDDLAAALIAELNEAGDFGDLTSTISEHYVVVSNTGQPYVDWTVAMLERLHDAFRAFWSRQGFETHDAEFALPVVILRSRDQFAKLATHDRTPVSAQGQGYFLVTANRTTLVDLTANEVASQARSRSEVQRLLQRNAGSVATVVHEATHQIAFNCGMHRRYADNPVWLTEGIAMYLETPDLNSRRGWRTIGRVNQNRLQQFREFASKRRQPDSLQTLLSDNARFAQAETAIDAYAEAWALTHFLIKSKPLEFNTYLQQIAAKPLLEWDTPEQRLAEFTEAFGDPSETDQVLQQYLRRLG